LNREEGTAYKVPLKLDDPHGCPRGKIKAGSRRVQRVPKEKGAKREMNTVKFWLEPALGKIIH
jgi:hypothetical protein